MKYKVIDISEEDYGCEGIPEDSELMCSVLIENSDGTQKWLKIADRYLRENGYEIEEPTEEQLAWIMRDIPGEAG